MKQVLLLVALVALISATNFDITSTSSCTNFAAGFCTRWEQNGTVQEQLGSCFPGKARVMTPRGLVSMNALKKGDFVLGWVDGREEFTRVTSWFHHDPNVQAEYLKLSLTNGFLEVSDKHNIAMDNFEYKFADEVAGGKLFYAGSVSSIETVSSVGKFAPKTEANNYFVFVEGSQTDKVLAHCFAHIRNPVRYEPIVEFIESTWNLFSDGSEELIHPSYTWMHNTMTILQE